jgi:hypothetical protein
MQDVRLFLQAGWWKKLTLQHHPQCSNHVKAAVQHASDPFLQRELLHPFQRVQVKRRILPDAEKELVKALISFAWLDFT